MQVSESELRSILAANPCLKIHGLPRTASPVKSTAEFRSQETKPAKYRNRKVHLYADGYADISGKAVAAHGRVTAVYDSQKEFRRHMELLSLEQAGMIEGLEWQHVLVIQDAFIYQDKRIRAITYKADFFYRQDENQIVEDVKGLDSKTGKHRTTPEFRLKWKLLMHKYPSFVFVLY